MFSFVRNWQTAFQSGHHFAFPSAINGTPCCSMSCQHSGLFVLWIYVIQTGTRLVDWHSPPHIQMCYFQITIRNTLKGCLGGSVGWASNYWFWLRSWSLVGWSPNQAVCWQHEACLGFSLFLSLSSCLSPACSCSMSLNLKKIYIFL